MRVTCNLYKDKGTVSMISNLLINGLSLIVGSLKQLKSQTLRQNSFLESYVSELKAEIERMRQAMGTEGMDNMVSWAEVSALRDQLAKRELEMQEMSK